MRLKHWKYIFLCFSCFWTLNAKAYMSSLAPISFDQLYAMAAQGNVSGLNNARSRGLNIDSLNMNGDTGLCVAAKSHNKKAYRAFLQAGANPSHSCTWNIRGYQEFMTSQTRAVFGVPGITSGVATGMSLGTTTLIGVGAVATGVGVAAAAGGGGGGGGGGGSDKNKCPKGSGHWGGEGDKKCYKTLDCQNGSKQFKDSCECSEEWVGQLCNSPKVCGEEAKYTSKGSCEKGYVSTYEPCEYKGVEYYNCDMCDEGYGNFGGDGCYEKLSCKNGSEQLKDHCTCSSEWVGTLCDSPKKCGKQGGYTSKWECEPGYASSVAACEYENVLYYKCDTCDKANDYDYYGTDTCHKKKGCENGQQLGDECVCDNGWTGELCTETVVCPENYQDTPCGEGYHETNECQSGNTKYVQCEANDCSGYEESCTTGYHVVSGDTCVSAGTEYVKCEANICEGYIANCPIGYIETESCDTPTQHMVKCGDCADGYGHWGGSGDSTCYKTLDCQNESVQFKDTCQCSDEWVGTQCDSPKVCGEGYSKQTVCEEGYTSSNPEKPSCEYQETTYYNCDACDEAHDYYNYGTEQCYLTLGCVHGQQVGGACVCEQGGWTGKLCDTPVNCGEDYGQTSCNTGYHETDQCWSGGTKYVKCEENTCNGYQASCGDGYHEVEGASCAKGEEIYIKCEANTCEGFSLTACPTGYIETANCDVPGKTLVQCNACDTANDYDYYETDTCHKALTCEHGGRQIGERCEGCDNGWSGASCDVPQSCGGYETACPSGYTEVPGDTCVYQDTTYVKCMEENCDEYASKECIAPYAPSSTEFCYVGDKVYYFCTECVPGYDKWGGEDDYHCYKTLNCVHGSQNKNECVCEDGWKGTLCDTPDTCAAGYTSAGGCPEGYASSYKPCPRGGVDYYKCDKCADNYHKDAGDNACYKDKECVNGEQLKDSCVCYDGWEGDLCEQEIDCGADYSDLSCWEQYGENAKFYIETECQSGYSTKYKCTFNTDVCEHGTVQGTACECEGNWQGDFCNECASGDVDGEVCYAVMDCGEHGYQAKGECHCVYGYTREGDACVAIDGYYNVNSPRTNAEITTDYDGTVVSTITKMDGSAGLTLTSTTPQTPRIGTKTTLYNGYYEVASEEDQDSKHKWVVNVTNGSGVVNELNNGWVSLLYVKGIYGYQPSGTYASEVNVTLNSQEANASDKYGVYSNSRVDTIVCENCSEDVELANQINVLSDFNEETTTLGNLYGIYAKTNVTNAEQSEINVESKFSHKDKENEIKRDVYGIYVEPNLYSIKPKIQNDGFISVVKNDNSEEFGHAYGIYAMSGGRKNIINTGDINSSYYGIYTQNADINNEEAGNILIKGDGESGFGVYATDNSIFENNGTIRNNNIRENQYGVYLNNSKLTNNQIIFGSVWAENNSNITTASFSAIYGQVVLGKSGDYEDKTEFVNTGTINSIQDSNIETIIAAQDSNSETNNSTQNSATIKEIKGIKVYGQSSFVNNGNISAGRIEVYDSASAVNKKRKTGVPMYAEDDIPDPEPEPEPEPGPEDPDPTLNEPGDQGGDSGEEEPQEKERPRPAIRNEGYINVSAVQTIPLEERIGMCAIGRGISAVNASSGRIQTIVGNESATVGMMVKNKAKATNMYEILNMTQYGMYAENESTITNYGKITGSFYQGDEGNVYATGIYLKNKSTGTNNSKDNYGNTYAGIISVVGDGNGVYADNSGFSNNGKISVEDGYGIYATKEIEPEPDPNSGNEESEQNVPQDEYKPYIYNYDQITVKSSGLTESAGGGMYTYNVEASNYGDIYMYNAKGHGIYADHAKAVNEYRPEYRDPVNPNHPIKTTEGANIYINGKGGIGVGGYNKAEVTNKGQIFVNGENAYGMYGNDSTVLNDYTFKQKREEYYQPPIIPDGATIYVYGTGSTGIYAANNASGKNKGVIEITEDASNSVGMGADHSTIINEYQKKQKKCGDPAAAGCEEEEDGATIHIAASGGTGMSATNVASATNKGVIQIDAGNAKGMYAKNSTILNDYVKKKTNQNTNPSANPSANEEEEENNGAIITISGANSSGIYAIDGSDVTNKGWIYLKGNNSYGIYAEKSTVVNEYVEKEDAQEINEGDEDPNGAFITLDGLNSYGIYALDESEIVNRGVIRLEGEDSDYKNYGIYAENSDKAEKEMTIENAYDYYYNSAGRIFVKNGYGMYLIDQRVDKEEPEDEGDEPQEQEPERLASTATNDYGTINVENGTGMYVQGDGSWKIYENQVNSYFYKPDPLDPYKKDRKPQATGINYGEINITNGRGMSAKDAIIVNESEGTINVENGIGMYGNHSIILNKGSITITNDGDNNYGIYAANKSYVYNTGTITIASESCSGPNCGGKYIHISSSTFALGGSLNSVAPLNFSTPNGGSVLMSAGANLTAPEISGDIGVATDVVSQGFDESYTLENAIVSENTTGLLLNSQSVLFNASLVGEDIVLNKKAFSDVVENKSIAEFLEHNYALENNEELFKNLKENTSKRALNDTIEDLMGDGLKRFAFEDMTMFKELSLDMNNAMFKNTKTDFTLTGNTQPISFEKNLGSRSRWSLSGKKVGNMSYGVGVAFTDIRSQDGDKNNNRKDEMFQMMMPLGYEKYGLEMISTLRLGYAYGHYTRSGYRNRSYDGKMEKRIFGVTNEVRYPMSIGGWKVAPKAEFNAIGYKIKGHEEEKEFALNIDEQNVYSVEGGVGFNLSKERQFSENHYLKFDTGMMVYHEFANPYELRLSMQDMDGSWKIRDEKRRSERLMIKNALEYNFDPFSIYANLYSYIDSEYRTKADIGFKYAF